MGKATTGLLLALLSGCAHYDYKQCKAYGHDDEFCEKYVEWSRRETAAAIGAAFGAAGNAAGQSAPPRRAVNCTTTYVGNTAFTNCY